MLELLLFLLLRLINRGGIESAKRPPAEAAMAMTIGYDYN
jgi:hypothetical protein